MAAPGAALVCADALSEMGPLVVSLALLISVVLLYGMDLLQAGVDRAVIAVWLGHESV